MTRNLKRVAITGANGVIGTVLRNGLSEFEITPIDLPAAPEIGYIGIPRQMYYCRMPS